MRNKGSRALFKARSIIDEEEKIKLIERSLIRPTLSDNLPKNIDSGICMPVYMKPSTPISSCEAPKEYAKRGTVRKFIETDKEKRKVSRYIRARCGSRALLKNVRVLLVLPPDPFSEELKARSANDYFAPF